MAYYHNEAQPSDYGKNDAAAIGIPGVNISRFTSGMVGISVGGFSSPMTGYAASAPWVRSEANIDVSNIWTKMAGNHTIKFGVDLRRLRDNGRGTQIVAKIVTNGESASQHCGLQGHG